MSGSAQSVVAGGVDNLVRNRSTGAAIGGGESNIIGDDAFQPTIGGGLQNNVLDGSAWSTVGGGLRNIIWSNVDGAVIAGGKDNAIRPRSDWSFIGGGEFNTVETNVQWTVIGGGQANYIRAYGSTIGGGISNVIDDTASVFVYSTIGGGHANLIGLNGEGAVIAGGDGNRNFGGFATIGGGLNNYVTGSVNTVSGGQANHILGGTHGTIAGGEANVISSDTSYGTIGGGDGNQIDATTLGATIPGGRDALAAHYGQWAYASGRFGSGGDAQTSVYVLRNTTSGTTTNTLFLDGSSERLWLTFDQTMAFDIQVVASTSDGGEVAGYHVEGLVQNFNGDIILFGPPTVVVLHEDDSSWNVELAENDLLNSLDINVVGGVGDLVRWVATVRATEVIYP